MASFFRAWRGAVKSGKVNALKSAIAVDEFYVFPHKVVKDYFINRALHPDAYLSGMRKLKAKVGEAFKNKG